MEGKPAAIKVTRKPQCYDGAYNRNAVEPAPRERYSVRVATGSLQRERRRSRSGWAAGLPEIPRTPSRFDEFASPSTGLRTSET